MKLTALCCTYNRPELLANALWMFQQQTHDDKELIIFDDADQFDEQHGDNWSLYTSPIRYRSFGEKRNVCAGFASLDTEAFVVWDDDDMYLPWALEAHAAALQHSNWSRPSLAWDVSKEWKQVPLLCEMAPHGMSYHGAWAFRRAAIEGIQGYPVDKAGDQDTIMGRRMLRQYGPSADSLDFVEQPFYVYCFGAAKIRFCDFDHWNVVAAPTEADIERWGKPEYIGELCPKEVAGYKPPKDAIRVPWLERPKWTK